MLNPIKTRAMGEAKQARYLEEAANRRLIKASQADQPTVALRLGGYLGQWLMRVGQRLQAAGAQLVKKSLEDVKEAPGS